MYWDTLSSGTNLSSMSAMVTHLQTHETPDGLLTCHVYWLYIFVSVLSLLCLHISCYLQLVTMLTCVSIHSWMFSSQLVAMLTSFIYFFVFYIKICSIEITYKTIYLRGAMGEISNFYNLSARLLIFNTHIPPIITTHISKFRSCLSDTFWIMIFSFLKKGLFSKSISSGKFKVYDLDFLKYLRYI